jgi:hypothetical protein
MQHLREITLKNSKLPQLKRARSGILLFWIGLVVLVTYGNLPSKWTGIGNTAWFMIQSFAPQHWIFTDIDAKAPQLSVYKIAADGSLGPLELRAMSASNKFGLRREHGTNRIAFRQIAVDIPNQDWITLEVDQDQTPTVDLSNVIYLPLKGKGFHGKACRLLPCIF